MKVFISWSGQRSRATAKLLYEWLPQIINEIEPWMSDFDIKTGGDWGDEIKAELNSAAFGVICVTPGNMKREWLLFEAGALSRQVGDQPGRVAPFMIGFNEKSELRYPLARFQATEPNKSDIRKLLLSINSLADKPRSVQQIDNALDVYWPSFEEPFIAIRDSVRAEQNSRRSEGDLLQEILSIVRSLDQKSTASLPASRGTPLLTKKPPLWRVQIKRDLPYETTDEDLDNYLRQTFTKLVARRGFVLHMTGFDASRPQLTIIDTQDDGSTLSERLHGLHADVSNRFGIDVEIKLLDM